MNRKVAAPLEISEGKVHWSIRKPTTLGGYVALYGLITIIVCVISGVVLFAQSVKDTTNTANQNTIEMALLKAKVDSIEAKMNAKLSTNRLILFEILRNTATNGEDAEKWIAQQETAEKDSIALFEQQRKEREEEVLRKIKEKK